MGVLAQVRDVLLVPWPSVRPYRLFDGRAEELGPYYVSFGRDRRSGLRHPIAILQFGLEQHTRWKRLGDRRARELFLATAEWAVAQQRVSFGVRGSYESPFPSKRYGCAGFRSARAQGEAISLLLRAYQETGGLVFLERAIDASVPLTVDVREGGVLWRSGDDVIFEGVAGVPGHILCGWICALWALFELSRTVNLDHIADLHRRSLSTLEKYLPSYDSGTWSYDNLLATTPVCFRRVATVQRHLLHVAQLDVLVSMNKSELFAVVAERWRRYSASLEGRLQAWVDGFYPASPWKD
jgi:heparosan-N-sulfate-glucuronate 5-epimerase